VTKAKSAGRPPIAAEPDDDFTLPEAWRKRPWIPYLIMVAVLAVVLGAGFAMNKALEPVVPPQLADCKTAISMGPHEFAGRQPICIQPNKVYTATLDTTQGKIVIQLIPQVAPVTVNNFVVLAVNGYYTGLTFHRVQDWVVQGGDPLGDGRGGPGYTLPAEPNGDAWDADAVGMARDPDGRINGSQFFILKAAWPNGGPGDTAFNHFGIVLGGTQIVSQIKPGDRILQVSVSVQ